MPPASRHGAGHALGATLHRAGAVPRPSVRDPTAARTRRASALSACRGIAPISLPRHPGTRAARPPRERPGTSGGRRDRRVEDRLGRPARLARDVEVLRDGRRRLRPLGEQHDLERDVVGQARLAHDVARVPLERLLVLAHRGGDPGRRRAQLAERVDERAPAEAVLAEPRVEEVEHREQAVAGRGRSRGGLRDPLVPPARALAQHGHDEVVLGREERVDALERHPGLGADGVHPDGLHALGVEQPVGRGHHGRAGARVVEHRSSPVHVVPLARRTIVL